MNQGVLYINFSDKGHAQHCCKIILGWPQKISKGNSLKNRLNEVENIFFH